MAKRITLLISSACFLMSCPLQEQVSGAKLAEDDETRISKFESGADTIDISEYPEAIQEKYKTFADKCSECHKLSRPINSDYALPDEWSRYVKRMMRKPGSGINAADAKKIYEFLVYDSVMRKKEIIDKKLAKATPSEKEEAEVKIQEIREKYDKK